MPKTGFTPTNLKKPFRLIANDQRPDFRSFLLAIANCIPDMQKQVLGTETLPDTFTYPEGAEQIGELDQLLHNLGCSSGPDGYTHIGTKMPNDQTIERLTKLADDLIPIMTARTRDLYKADDIDRITAFQEKYALYASGITGLKDIAQIRNYRAVKKATQPQEAGYKLAA